MNQQLGYLIRNLGEQLLEQRQIAILNRKHGHIDIAELQRPFANLVNKLRDASGYSAQELLNTRKFLLQ
ncbi:MAG TPA: hypothetical protein DDZ89_03570, partial [Clostridiales bacterium]|nr:hypothetical protein [Clostridiales bacterium]